MTAFSRTDTSLLGRWWWTVDRWSIAAVALLVVFGVMLTMAASPPVADRLGFDSYHFVRRQLTYLPIALTLLFAASLLSPRGVRRTAITLFALGLLLLPRVRSHLRDPGLLATDRRHDSCHLLDSHELARCC